MSSFYNFYNFYILNLGHKIVCEKGVYEIGYVKTIA